MRLREARRASQRGGLLLAILILISSPAAHAVPRPELAGTVRDAVGSLLRTSGPGPARERGPEPVAVAHTDLAGRFLVTDLPVGTYRVVAVKDGYATWLGRVSMALRTTLDLVLQPVVVDPTLDADWSLRVSDRSLLRDTDAAVVLGPRWAAGDGRGGTTMARMEPERAVQGELDYLFAFGADQVEGPRARMEGGDSRVLLTSHPGERTYVRFEGQRHSLDAASGSDLARSHELSNMELEVSYDTSLDGQLAVQAFYGSRDSSLRPVAGNDRVFGYDASFSRQRGPPRACAWTWRISTAGWTPTSSSDRCRWRGARCARGRRTRRRWRDATTFACASSRARRTRRR